MKRMKRTFSTAIDLLDGGMGHLLRRKGVEISGPIGSQRRFLGICLANIENPDLVRAAHEEFIDAGARVIITNNYAVVPACLELSGEQFDLSEIITASCIQAKRAVGSRKDIKIAGSMPPLKASYRPDEVGEFDDMLESYQQIAVALEPHVDYFICETMSKVDEAIAAASACDIISEKEVHVAFTLAESTEGRLRSGEPIEKAVAAMRKYSNVTAVLVNCSSIESTNAVLPKLRNACGSNIRFGAYANAFNTVFSDGKKSDYDESITPGYYANVVNSWLDEGATIVGGCCGLFPEHIQSLSEVIKNRKLAS